MHQPFGIRLYYTDANRNHRFVDITGALSFINGRISSYMQSDRTRTNFRSEFRQERAQYGIQYV